MNILFRGIVDETTLGKDAFTIIPEPTEVYSYFYPYDNRWVISWPRQPETDYTVTLSGDIADVFGNELGDAAHPLPDRPAAPLRPPQRAQRHRHLQRLHQHPDRGQLPQRQRAELQALQRQRKRGRAGCWAQDRWDAAAHVHAQGATPCCASGRCPCRRSRNTNNLSRCRWPRTAGRCPRACTGSRCARRRSGTATASQESGQLPPRHLLIVSPFNLVTKRTVDEILVWATDLQSGQPVADLPVRMVGDDEAAGVTDADGIMRGAGDDQGTVAAGDRLCGSMPDATTGGGGTPPLRRDQHRLAERAGLVGLRPAQRIPAAALQGYFYSDRPIYRPGQTVYWKGILRVDDDAILRVPEPGTKVNVVIRNDRGEEIYKQQHETNAFGTIDGELPLAEEASLASTTWKSNWSAGRRTRTSSPTSAWASRWPSTASRSSPSS